MAMNAMLSLEKLANANTKNRVEYSQLSTLLSRLEKEKQNELRMINNEIQRFKAKYSKFNFTQESPEASNVKMYETHNPGFCFKRNGEHKVQQLLDGTPSVDFEHLHFFLFTNGEVDIEKILCLHLLSSHETNHLASPKRPTGNSFMKKDSPLEQLIERSKENPKEKVLKAILPTYVLDVQRGNPKRSLTDERLSSRLLVNEKILELISTVISALEHSNPEKVEHLISIAEDPSRLKRIFRKQHIQDFVMTLKNHSLISSSFILTQPTKLKANHLDIRTPSGALEDLVRFIRSNVLQFPKHGSWNIVETDSKDFVTIEQNNALKLKTNLSFPKKESLEMKISLKKEPLSTIEEYVPTKMRRREVNYIQKNIDMAPKYKRFSDEDPLAIKPKKRRLSDDSTKKIEGKKRTSVDSGKKTFSRTSSKENVRVKRLSFLDHEHPLEDLKDDDVKVHLKQTKCKACMERWKISLPEPKVPSLTAKEVSPTGSAEKLNLPVMKTDSRKRVINLIEQEEYKLASYDRKYSNASSSSTPTRKQSTPQGSSLDLVALNILDLEKIRHEIREKETQKKLEKFLGKEKK